MGVRGLATYFSNRDLFFDEVRLKDCKVVIDGNNLRFALYKWCPGLNHCFGGDYDKYARFVRQYFRQLLASGVSPIVVFDGGYDKNDQKLATVVRRRTEQTRNAVACNPVTQGKLQVFPIFGRAVFQEVLEELGVRLVQCSYEADHVIAQLAMAEDCPVISNDSDFFIFNVRFISLDSLQLDTGEGASCEEGVLCRMFDRARLLDHYSIASTELLHLLAALLGNDYIPPQVFEKIFLNIKLPKKSKDGSERHRRIKGLLLYLAKERTVETALNRLLQFFQETEKGKLKERVLKSMAIYSGGADCGVISQDFSTWEGRPLPPWFSVEYHSSGLPGWLLGIAACRKYFLPTQVECRSLPSCHLAALPLHQALVNLLTSPDSDLGSVSVYGRVGGGMAEVVSLEPCPGQETLAGLRELGLEERRLFLRSLLCPGLKEEQLGGVPEQLQLLTLVLDLWTRSSQVSSAAVVAVLLCHTVFTRVDPTTGAERSSRRLGERQDQGEFWATAATLAPAFHVEESLKTSLKKFEPSLVHSFSVLQAITFAAVALNNLLGNVFVFPKIGDLFNGTFIYNVTMQLSKAAFKKKILPSEVDVEFQKTLETVMKIVTNVKEEIRTTKVKKSKKKPPPVEEEEITAGKQSDLFQDLGNRFSALAVE